VPVTGCGKIACTAGHWGIEGPFRGENSPFRVPLTTFFTVYFRVDFCHKHTASKASGGCFRHLWTL
jgi:hypothetical protein